MGFFSRLLSSEKAVVPSTATPVVAAGTGGLGLWRTVLESYAGAFQRDVVVDEPRQLLSYSTLYSAITGIASDVAKMGTCLVEEDEEGVRTPVRRNSPYLPFFRRPNHYQTWYKFIEQWTLSKLLWGNTYVLKERDARGIVIAAYILDAARVTPLVTEQGLIYYDLKRDPLSGLTEESTIVPANDIFHDMMCSLWHPLVGISPIYACALSTTMGVRIQRNSTKFFDNMSRPSGILTAPGTIPDETAARLKKYWEENYTVANIGRLAVLGDGMKYEAMTIPAKEAELVDQLKWTGVDIANSLHYPLHKLGQGLPQGSSPEAATIMYYTDCLQPLIESTEAVLDYGLGLPAEYYTRFDLDNLLRMDTAALIKSEAEAVKGVIKSTNEARNRLNLKPVKGGGSPMIQQQNYSLEAVEELHKKEGLLVGKPTPTPTPTPAPTPDPEEPPVDEAAKLVEFLIKGMRNAA